MDYQLCVEKLSVSVEPWMGVSRGAAFTGREGLIRGTIPELDHGLKNSFSAAHY